MIAGVSTASLYPMETEVALRKLGELGINNAEIFVNDISETGGAILNDILSIIDGCGLLRLSETRTDHYRYV